MNIKQSITELIGHTPLLRLNGYERKHGLDSAIIAKLEYFNVNQSSKDRTAMQIVTDAEENGTLKSDDLIIETTSGNTGISLAAIAAVKGYGFLAYMQDGVSRERFQNIEAFGSKTILFSEVPEVREALKKSNGNFIAGLSVLKEKVRNEEGVFYTDQCFNDSNIKAHREHTGPEIWEDTDGTVDILVASVGTGGTITGAAQYLKRMNPEVRIVAVEPDAEYSFSEDDVEKGVIDGIERISDVADEERPGTIDMSIIDEILEVSANEAFTASREVARSDGVLLGSSSGAAIHAARLIAGRKYNAGKTIVVIAPDTGLRYLSTKLFR